jgi:hypothetical protein
MRNVPKLWFVWFVVCATNSQGQNPATSDWQHAPLGTGVQISDHASGLLQYRGSFKGINIVALSTDVGNAEPDADLSIYMIGPKAAILVTRFSFLHREFDVSLSDGKLIVTLSRSDTDFSPGRLERAPLATIDLEQLVKAYKQSREWPQ